MHKSRPIIYQLLPRLFGNTRTDGKPGGTLKENGVGKMNDITDKALKEIKSLGITHIWYTGIIEHATQTDYSDFGIPADHPSIVKGKAGSAYAIKDYYDVDPDLAESVPDRMMEFEELVDRTHRHQLKVLVDFVPNHVARQYHSDAKPEGVEDLGVNDDTHKAFDPHNNFYYLPGVPFHVPDQASFIPEEDPYYEFPSKASGNDVFKASPSIHDWFETIKINYGVDYQNSSRHFDPIPDTWHKMKEILLFWASGKVDGFRCDMAEMVPVEFWNWAIREVKTLYPHLLFIAEIYDPSRYRNYISQGGFDFLYDKVELYDTLKQIIRRQSTADDITRVWQHQEGIGDHMLRFLENHDEQRIASPFFAGDMKKGIPMMVIAAWMYKGPVMIYFGQEVGEPAAGVSGFSGDDGRTTIFDYGFVPEHLKWMNEGRFDGKKLSAEQKKLREIYQWILSACNRIPEFQHGQFYDLQFFNRNEKYMGYSDRVFAFLRHTNSTAILVVVNFSSGEENAHIKIPKEALTLFLSTEQSHISLGEGQAIDINSIISYHSPSQLSIPLRPLSYRLIRIC